jgi:CDGSH-type Zn-finger protein/uncharacterized Fe-S cluster protein YjdI
MSEKNPVFEWRGEPGAVTWDKRLCIHVGECTRAEGELFKKGRDPWCNPDLSDRADVAEVVVRCPTGALAFHPASGDPETPPERNTAAISSDGPIYLHGDLSIEGASDDMPGVRTRAALCRCGESANKPFCDGSHEKAGFADAGAVGRKGNPETPVGGSLAVTPAENGPLLVTGNLTIVAGSGREAWHGAKTALCRCGQSANKPFCDGTHSKVGFTG